MRSDLELVNIAIRNFHLFSANNHDGLCGYLTSLCNLHDIITVEERVHLGTLINKYIKDDTILNRLFYNKRRIRYYGRHESAYYWYPGDPQPRLGFLFYLSGKLSRNAKRVKISFKRRGVTLSG